MVLTFINKYKGERPQINLTIQRVESNVWEMFKHHHYMTQSMSKSAKCFLISWNSTPVGFISILNRVFKGCNKYDHMVSRMVILPQFQGLRLSKLIFNTIGGIIKSINGNLYVKTLNGKVGRMFERSQEWQPTAYNKKSHKKDDPRNKNSYDRISYCFKYVGDPIYGYQTLLLPIKTLRSLSKKVKTYDND